jgi:hypothetical protein
LYLQGSLKVIRLTANDSGRAQLIELAAVDAELPEDLPSMLTQSRRREIGVHALSAEAHG